MAKPGTPFWYRVEVNESVAAGVGTKRIAKNSPLAARLRALVKWQLARRDAAAKGDPDAVAELEGNGTAWSKEHPPPTRPLH
jgi:hypothetical protein